MMPKFSAIIILTLVFLQMALELRLRWILAALIVASFAFMLVQLGRETRITKRKILKSAIDCGASFFVGLAGIPFILEVLEQRGWVVSVPLIGVICLFVMFFGYQIRPIVLMFLRTKGLDTERIEEKDEKENK